MNLRQVTSLLLFVAGAGALAACSGATAPGPARGEPPLGDIPVVTSPGSATLPMDAYGITVDQQAMDYRARDMLIRDCLRRAGATGWTGTMADLSHSIDVYKAAARKIRFGLVDEVEAATFGYQGSPELAPPPSIPNGSPAFDSCSREAKLKLAEGAPSAEDFILAIRLPRDAAARVSNDSRYQALVEAWRACMKAAGYDFTSPEDAAEDTRWPEDTLSQAEVATAVQDVRCKKQANYLGTVVALRTAYENQLIEENAEAMQRLKTYYEQRSKRIADLVAAG